MESLSSRSFVKSRAHVYSGGFAAGSLGDLKDAHRSAKRLASRICKTHVWRESKYSRTCTRCGFVEDK
jgi:hypothetical protein